MKQLGVALLLLSGSIGAKFLHGEPSGSHLPASVLDIRQRGASGNGSTDDTAAIAAVFAEVCSSGGGTIHVPAGTYIINPGAGPLPLCSNLVVQGPGTFKVKPDAGNYRSIFATARLGAAVDNLTFSGITVDQNAAANTTATITVADVGTRQNIWQVNGGTNIHFENMHLVASGVNPIDVNGATISGVYIERNFIVFQKRPGQPLFDNSSIYIDGDNFHVTDNTFVSTLADSAVTAIEIHTGSGSVAGNTVDSYEVGMNLVDLRGASATGNNVRGAGYGISLWSTKKMDSVTVSDNTVSIAQVKRKIPVSWGIATAFVDGTNGAFSNLRISDNVVTFEPESSPRDIAGYANYGVGLQALGDIANALVLGNQIIRAPVRGITVGVANAKYTTARVSVRDNQIVDAGSNLSQGGSSYSAAIAVQGNLSSIEVARNRLDFPSIPFIGRYSYWSSETGFTFRDVVVADNYTTAATGSSPANGLTASVKQTYPPQ
jgi:hypothetical protein